MKKNILGYNNFSFLFIFGLLINFSTSANTQPSWSMGSFVDQWGDRTGERFIQFNETIDVIISTTAGPNNHQNVIRDLRFSEQEGLLFYVNFRLESSGLRTIDVIFNIRLADGSTIELNGRGQNDRARMAFMYFIPYSDELRNALLQENIVIRFETDRVRCQFNFPPRFAEAYHNMRAR